jgi:hypothetical protein
LVVKDAIPVGDKGYNARKVLSIDRTLKQLIDLGDTLFRNLRLGRLLRLGAPHHKYEG